MGCGIAIQQKIQQSILEEQQKKQLDLSQTNSTCIQDLHRSAAKNQSCVVSQTNDSSVILDDSKQLDHSVIEENLMTSRHLSLEKNNKQLQQIVIQSQRNNFHESASQSQSSFDFKNKKTIIITEGNNHQLIINYFSKKKNWKITVGNTKSLKFKLKWTQYQTQINWVAYNEKEQIVNHIQGAVNWLLTKTGLNKTLRNEEIMKKYPNFNILQYVPETYIISFTDKYISDDEQAFLKLKEKDNGYWLLKPYDQFGGHGIQLITDLRKFKMKYVLNKIKPIRSKTLLYVLQRYIERPLLLEKKKCDIRCYLLIAHTNPLLVLFHHGYVRLSMFPYQHPSQTQDVYIHLTNTSVQERHRLYRTQKEDQMWSMDRFTNYLKSEYGLSNQRLEEFEKKIMKILCYTVKSCQKKLVKRQGCFEFIGCDFMVDDKFNLYFIELSENPGIDTDTKMLEEFVPNLVNITLDIILKLHQNADKVYEKLANDKIDFKSYTVLINEAKRFSMI